MSPEPAVAGAAAGPPAGTRIEVVLPAPFATVWPWWGPRYGSPPPDA